MRPKIVEYESQFQRISAEIKARANKLIERFVEIGLWPVVSIFNPNSTTDMDLLQKYTKIEQDLEKLIFQEKELNDMLNKPVPAPVKYRDVCVSTDPIEEGIEGTGDAEKQLHTLAEVLGDIDNSSLVRMDEIQQYVRDKLETLAADQNNDEDVVMDDAAAGPSTSSKKKSLKQVAAGLEAEQTVLSENITELMKGEVDVLEKVSGLTAENEGLKETIANVSFFFVALRRNSLTDP